MSVPESREDSLVTAYRDRMEARVEHVERQLDELIGRILQLEGVLSRILTALTPTRTSL